tara:strand:- start:2745 stop:4223 length:1479 start_codon:yes stop_codon:yes gene_type:complete
MNDSNPIEIPPLTGIYAEPFSFSKLFRMMSFFGPAAIVASISLGAGETIMVTGLGAWSEYGLLWLLLLSVVVKGIFVTYLTGRYTAVTGQRIGHRLVMLPGPRGWLLLGVVIAEVGLVSMGLTAVAKPCGNLITFLLYDSLPGQLNFGVWENLWTCIILTTALLIGLLSSFHSLERQQVVICGVLVTGTIAATIIVQPDVWGLLTGAVSFGSMPAAPEWAPSAARRTYGLNLVTIFGYVGGGLSGYLAYSSWISMEGWGINSHAEIKKIRQRADSGTRIKYLPDDPEQARRMRALLMPLRWDVGMGALVLFIVTATFLAAGATVLFPRQEAVGGNAWELLTKQAYIWRQVSQSLVPVYYVMVLVALWGTLASIPEAITRVTHEFLSAIWPRFESFPIRRLQTIIVGWFILTSTAWTWSGTSFDIVTQFSAFLTLNLGLFLVFSCVLYFNFNLPALYRPSWWMLAGGIVAALVLLLCAIVGLMGLTSKLAAAF